MYLAHLSGTPLGSRPIRAVRTSEIQAWVANRSAVLAPVTVRNVYTFVKSVFASAVEDRLVTYSPCTSRIALPQIERKEVVPLTVEQVRVLADVMPDRYRMAVILQAALGLRLSELLALQVSDVDFLRRTVRIERQLATDGRRFVPLKTAASRRTVPLASDVTWLLSAHVAQFPPGSDNTIFTTTFGNPVRQNVYSDMIFKPAVSRAGLPGDVTTHALRHHFASVLLRQGVPVNVVSHAMGHSTAALVLSTYGHLMPGSDDLTRDALDAAWRHVSPAVSPDQAQSV